MRIRSLRCCCLKALVGGLRTRSAVLSAGGWRRGVGVEPTSRRKEVPSLGGHETGAAIQWTTFTTRPSLILPMCLSPPSDGSRWWIYIGEVTCGQRSDAGPGQTGLRRMIRNGFSRAALHLSVGDVEGMKRLVGELAAEFFRKARLGLRAPKRLFGLFNLAAT